MRTRYRPDFSEITDPRREIKEQLKTLIFRSNKELDLSFLFLPFFVNHSEEKEDISDICRF